MWNKLQAKKDLKQQEVYTFGRKDPFVYPAFA